MANQTRGRARTNAAQTTSDTNAAPNGNGTQTHVMHPLLASTALKGMTREDAAQDFSQAQRDVVADAERGAFREMAMVRDLLYLACQSDNARAQFIAYLGRDKAFSTKPQQPKDGPELTGDDAKSPLDLFHATWRDGYSNVRAGLLARVKEIKEAGSTLSEMTRKSENAAVQAKIKAHDEAFKRVATIVGFVLHAAANDWHLSGQLAFQLESGLMAFPHENNPKALVPTVMGVKAWFQQAEKIARLPRAQGGLDRPKSASGRPTTTQQPSASGVAITVEHAKLWDLVDETTNRLRKLPSPEERKAEGVKPLEPDQINKLLDLITQASAYFPKGELPAILSAYEAEMASGDDDKGTGTNG